MKDRDKAVFGPLCFFSSLPLGVPGVLAVEETFNLWRNAPARYTTKRIPKLSMVVRLSHFFLPVPISFLPRPTLRVCPAIQDILVPKWRPRVGRGSSCWLSMWMVC